MANLFNVPVFFIVWREVLEAGIILAVLTSFVKQTCKDDPEMRKMLLKQIWIGALTALIICLALGGAFIGVFYRFQDDIWGTAEDIWEGTFSLIASILITLMGLAILRISALQDKWRAKLFWHMERRRQNKSDAEAGVEVKKQGWFKNLTEKYSMAFLPFITVLREGIEAIVFVGGVSLGQPASSFPLAVICGILVGVMISTFIYMGGNILKLHWFLIVSTCLMYLIGAGLFSKAVWSFEQYRWNKLTGGDAAETGSGPGSYDIRNSVWHVNTGNPELKTSNNGGWMIFNAILGWTNSATIGSVVSYCVYWIVITCALLFMRWDENRTERGAQTILFWKRRKIARQKAMLEQVNENMAAQMEQVEQKEIAPSSSDSSSADKKL